MTRLPLRAAAADAIGREAGVAADGLDHALAGLDAGEVLGAELRGHAKAVTEHPDFPDYRYRYGLLLNSVGRTGDALEEFRAAVALNPSYVKARVKLGLTAWQTGRLEEATRALEEAVRLAPRYVDLHYRLGLVYADRGMWPLAVEQYQRAASLQPNAEAVAASLALALENMGLVGEEASPFAPPAPATDGAPSAAPTRDPGEA
jgi:tetratricopeptide (TPR) repeat protein